MLFHRIEDYTAPVMLCLLSIFIAATSYGCVVDLKKCEPVLEWCAPPSIGRSRCCALSCVRFFLPFPSLHSILAIDRSDRVLVGPCLRMCFGPFVYEFLFSSGKKKIRCYVFF